MTLREFIDLKILRDNVQILEFIPDVNGFGSLNELCNCVRSYSLIDELLLIKKGLDLKYFDYEVIELWGTKSKFKIGIVIQKK